MTTALEISTDMVEPECGYHDCDEPPVELWFGVTVEQDIGEIYSWISGYCPTHVEQHAKPQSNVEHFADITQEPVEE